MRRDRPQPRKPVVRLIPAIEARNPRRARRETEAVTEPSPRLHLRICETAELEEVEAAIRARVGPEPEALKAYRQSYERALPPTVEPATVTEVFNAAAAADLVLIGDYHTLATAQRTALALVRALARRRALVLGLEMVRAEHQRVLDAYAEGTVSAPTLRNLIRYDALWPFPWSAYGPLLALGREGVRLLALDGRGSLERRDRLTANRLVSSRAARPEWLHVAIVGDLHLAPAHLPALIAARRPDDRVVVVHQNLPAVHSRLSELHIGARVPAAQLGDGHFCLVTTTPLVRERSYLSWLEGAEEPAEDHAAELVRAAARLTALLNLPAGFGAAIEECEVHVRGAAAFLRALEASGLPFAKLIALRRQIAERSVAVAGPRGPVFIGQADAQHYAAAAAALVQALVGEPAPGPDRADPRGREADLLAAVRREAFAVLAWRLLEPLAGTLGEPLAVAFDPAAGPPPVHMTLRVERRARLLRARVAAHLNGRRRFQLPGELLDENGAFRAAVARTAGAHYADGLHDALLQGRVRPATAAALLSPPGPAGRARERRALIALATLARAGRAIRR
jgi:Haem-binding uptake, Tiki superfamily, ChaN